jgi:hypothetical protein
VLELLNILKECKEERRTCKNLCKLTQQERFYDEYDPQVNLEVKGFMILQILVDFGSQVNIFPKETWIGMVKPYLVRSNNFLKLAYQRFVEPNGILKGTKTVIMRIPTMVILKLLIY